MSVFSKQFFSKPTWVWALAMWISLSAISGVSHAAEAADSAAPQVAIAGKGVSNKQAKVIADKIMQASQGLHVTKVSATEIKGIHEVEVDGRGTVYAAQDGDFFFVGELYRVEPNSLVNVTEQKKNGVREKLLASLDRDDMIVFSPKGEVKASITVFTDVDCGYCQKLHQEVPQMNDMGIEVRYLAYPRAGIGSESYQKVVSAWCADNKQEALTRLKQRQSIPNNACENNPVAKQFQIGQLMGVTGTPSLILENGEMVPGYMPAQRLAERLGVL